MVQDLLDYVETQRVQKNDRRSPVPHPTDRRGAEMAEERTPTGTDFDEVVRRLRARFDANDGARTEWRNEFWNRRQTSDEPDEEMACLAHRMRLDAEP